jgi:transposase, IS30 family
MACKERLSRDARGVIEAELTEDPEMSWTGLGRRVGVHRSTVEREVNRNRGRVKYSADAAHLASSMAAQRPRERQLALATPLRVRVTSELEEKRSPAAIAADLRAEGGETVSAESIYGALYAGVLTVAPRDCLRSRRRKRRRRQERHENRRAGLPNISKRPKKVNERRQVGHLELDLIVGARNASAMLVAIERATRYSALVTLPEGYRAEAVLAAMCELFDQVPPHLRRSATFDQGSEWAEWESLVGSYGMAVWFCDPHSPWQRGAVENHNGHVRHWFPRGTDLAGVTPQRADKVARLLNGQRRKSLGWESAESRWLAAGGVLIESPQTRLESGLVVVGG